MTANVVSLSGGKDSTAMALLAIERETDNLQFVFADTGHEHPQTYDYVAYLDAEFSKRAGVGIQWVRADFTERMAGKRAYITAKWPDAGVSQAHIDRALEILHPTGNPFLDMCLWKGRFPSPKARFCTTELKHDPIEKQVVEPLLESDGCVVSWQGVRADESESRKHLPERDAEFGAWEPEPNGLLVYRPLLTWTAEDVFAQHRKHGVDWNPLYEQGMGRVGCMPCIMARKGELYEIGRRFPEEVARVAEWERLVGMAGKRGHATFFQAKTIPGNSRENEEVNLASHGIGAIVQWSRTTRGGRQYDLERMAEDDIEAPTCSSIYGLCE